MSQLTLKNVEFVTGEGQRESSVIVVDRGLIVAVDRDGQDHIGEEYDLTGCRLFPGFIDVHNHGAVGVDVNGADAEGLLKAAKFLARHGVTSWLPTIVPDSDANYRRIIDEIDRLMELQNGKPVAQAIGVHYEGVFANERMCGALRPEYFKAFQGNEIEQLPTLKSGVHMMTLPPEVEGGIELAKALVDRGWVVSIGHTAASVERLDAAFDAGARHITHFFNAMTPVHHRDLGVAGWGLSKEGVTFDIIADGVHVHPKMLNVACRARSIESVSLISDSVAPTGLGDGEFTLWGETVNVVNGKTQNSRGSIAGSVCTMFDCFRTMRVLGFDDAELAQLTSTNPARLVGSAGTAGTIEIGMLADLVAIDRNGNIRMTIVRGQVVEC